MSVLKALLQNSVKLVFTFSTLLPGVISITNSLLLLFVSQSKILCCNVWEMFAFLTAAWKYSSSDLPVSYKIYTSLHEGFPKFMPMKTQVLVALHCSVDICRRGLLLHPIIILPFKFRTTNSHTCAYSDLLENGSCQCEKSFVYTFQVVLLPLVVCMRQFGPFSIMLS